MNKKRMIKSLIYVVHPLHIDKLVVMEGRLGTVCVNSVDVRPLTEEVPCQVERS